MNLNDIDINRASVRRPIGQALFPGSCQRSHLPRSVKRPRKRPAGQIGAADLIIPKSVLDAQGRCTGEGASLTARCVSVLEAEKTKLGIVQHEVTESGSLTITLDRDHAIRNCIGQLLASTERHCPPASVATPSSSATTSSPPVPVLIDVSAFLLLPAHAALMGVDSLRALLAAQHLANVLSTQGAPARLVANSIGCRGHLLQAAIVLACVDGNDLALSSGWAYSKEFVQQLCHVAEFIADDITEDVPSRLQALLDATRTSLHPSSSSFSAKEVEVMKSILITSQESLTLPLSATLVRQIHAIPKVWDVLLQLRKLAVQSCLSMASRMAVWLTLVDSMGALIVSEFNAYSANDCMIKSADGGEDNAACPDTRHATSAFAGFSSHSPKLHPETNTGASSHSVDGLFALSECSNSTRSLPFILSEADFKPAMLCPHQSACPSVCSVDGAASMELFNLATGKRGYDQSAATVICRDRSGLLSPVSAHALHLLRLSERFQSPIIHAVSSGHLVFLQRCDLLCHSLASASAPPLAQPIKVQHLVVSGVEVSDSNCPATCHQYLESCYAQMIDAAVCKLGRSASNAYVQQCAMGMTISCVKLQLLTPPLSHVVKTRILSAAASPSGDVAAADGVRGGGVQDSKDGVFALYNYARLATLLNKFESEVAAGTYPPLPPLEDINFALLTDESEWQLMLAGLPSLADSLVDMLPGDDVNQSLSPASGIYFGCSLNKVCLFLVEFCRHLSSYYCRVHILEEPSPHRFPVMFARLYLLMACKQVLTLCLDLLGLERFDLM